MTDTARAQMFLASQRGRSESLHRQSFYTFNFAANSSSPREAFFAIRSFNEETLAPLAFSQYNAEEHIRFILIPLVGTCECRVGNERIVVDAGQVFSCCSTTAPIEIRNPFTEHYINYILIKLFSKQIVPPSVTGIAIEDERNMLMPIQSAEHRIYLGMYDGRREQVVECKPGKAFFVFVIEGAFEVNNRLLHRRDGVGIWNAGQLEFESLSNDAVILVAEITV